MHATSCAGALGESPKDYIRSFIVLRAKSPILGGQSMSLVSEQWASIIYSISPACLSNRQVKLLLNTSPINGKK